MNAEISKIRRMRNDGDSFEYQPTRISDDRINELTYQLNINFSDLYLMERNNNIDTSEFVKKFIENIYIILTMFDEMGIYPDCFFDEIVKMNIEYKKVADDKSIRGNYQIFKNINLSARVSKAIINDFKKGYYTFESYPQKDINENFLEMIGFFQTFDIPYNINTQKQCAKVFNDLKMNHFNIMDAFINGDDIYDDIEYLSRLLFEYMSFFVSMGIYPKEYLDNYIEEQEKGKHR